MLVGLDGPATAALHASGQPIPAPIQARGLIDTGCNVTCISQSVLQRLGLAYRYGTTTQTVTGPASVKVYKVSLSITDFSTPGVPLWMHSNLLSMELLSALPDVDVLIGLDIVLTCRMLVDGPASQFTLDF